MFIKHFILPKFCLGCGFLGAYICLKCQKKLSYIRRDTCLYCGKASLFGLTHFGCSRRRGIDGMICLFYYNNFLKKLIKSIKYRLATEVFDELRLVIEPEKLSKISVFKKLRKGRFLLQPIPLHPSRRRIRGFNQAKLLADYFADYIDFDIVNYLQRKKNTLSQAQIKMDAERYKNMTGAFQSSDQKVRGQNIILVDDVITTGSTVKEAAKSLKQSGARNVFVLALAKG